MNVFRKIMCILSIPLPSFLRVRFLKVLGYDIDQKAIIKPFSAVLVKNIKLGAYAKIDSFVVIAGLRNIVLKEHSTIQRFTYISGGHSFKLGQRSLIGSRCIVNTASGDIEFGEYSALAPRSSIYTHGTFLPVTLGYSTKNKGVKVGDYCWIMQSSSISPGVNIGSNSIVLPGSTIVKKVPDNIVVYDTPMDRKTFPIEVFRKELNDNELLDLIREISIAFFKALLKSKVITFYSDHGTHIILKDKMTTYKVVFDKPTSVIDLANGNSGTTFFWSFNIDKEILKTTQYFVLDFLHLYHSSVVIPKICTNLNQFICSGYGLKFIDIKYSHDDYNILSYGEPDAKVVSPSLRVDISTQGILQERNITE